MINFNYNNFAAVPYFQFCTRYYTLLSNLRKRRIGTQQPLTNLDKNIKKPETQSNFTFKQPKSPPAETSDNTFNKIRDIKCKDRGISINGQSVTFSKVMQRTKEV